MRKLKPEEAFLGHVLELAGHLGYLRHHQRPALTARGYRSAIQGDKGFLDTVLCHERRRRLFFLELKAEGGRVTREQEAWLGALRACGAEAHVFKPSDFDEIQRLLTS